jgi:hypothetical protein
MQRLVRVNDFFDAGIGDGAAVVFEQGLGAVPERVHDLLHARHFKKQDAGGNQLVFFEPFAVFGGDQVRSDRRWAFLRRLAM